MEIILLHGALSTSSQLIPLQRELERSASVQLLDFPSHGKGKKEPFSMPQLVEFLKNFVDKKSTGSLNLFGYSMGGYAALALAAEINVAKVITLGTKLEWNPNAAEKEIKMLNPAVIKTKVPAFAASLENIHGKDWADLVRFTAEMMQGLGNDPLLNNETFGKISAAVMLMRGEDDNMVSREETIDAASRIPNARVVSLPGVPHALEKIDPLFLAGKVLEFCNE